MSAEVFISLQLSYLSYGIIRACFMGGGCRMVNPPRPSGTPPRRGFWRLGFGGDLFGLGVGEFDVSGEEK
jgi:hypothetical protein